MKKIYLLTIKQLNKFEVLSEQKYGFLNQQDLERAYKEVYLKFKNEIGKNPGYYIFVDEIPFFETSDSFVVNNNVNRDPLRMRSKGIVFDGGRKRPFR